METKRFDALDVKAEPSGEFEALVSTFDKVDKFGDIVRPGAFRGTIEQWRRRKALIPVVFSHQADDPEKHIGEVDPQHLDETRVGLVASGRFYLDEPIAAKVFKQLQRKAISEWSFAFRILKAKPLTNGLRELLRLDLIELGPCMVGVGDTATLSVKSARAHEEADPLAARRAQLNRALRRFELDVALARYR